MVKTLQPAEQYHWGKAGTGWLLTNSENVGIVQEQIAPGVREIKHYHRYSWQIFYVLRGFAEIDIDGKTYMVGPNQSIEVAPGMTHQLRNNGDTDVQFLLVSSPNNFNDRVEVDYLFDCDCF